MKIEVEFTYHKDNKAHYGYMIKIYEYEDISYAAIIEQHTGEIAHTCTDKVTVIDPEFIPNKRRLRFNKGEIICE